MLVERCLRKSDPVSLFSTSTNQGWIPNMLRGDTGVCLLLKHKVGMNEFKAQGIAVCCSNKQVTQLVSVSINPS